MCRLLGWVSDEPRALADLLTPGELAEFTALSLQHADGWGIAWYDADGALQTMRSEDPAHSSVAYAEAVAGIASTGAILHLRWATPGIPVQPGNTHPFVRDESAFAHNGSIWPRDGLLDLLDAEPALEGTSDSELYLLALLQRVRAFGFDEGLRETIVDITAELTPSSLNAMLLGNGVLTAMCCNIGDAGCPGVSGPETPPEELPGYYDLRYRDLGGATVVSSSGWADDAGWSRIDNGTAMVLPAGGGAVRVVPIGVYPEAAATRATKKRVTGEL
ncbi:class II glutamine amidotransferase [Acidothermaceae bacterium B102]|nr:class II glutamine amidotransferase [Acidothermaceae bacterium B102]